VSSAAAHDDHLRTVLNEVALDSEERLLATLMALRNAGLP
jgi:hypothetical protein